MELMTKHFKKISVLSTVALLMFGCGGDDGNPGEPGEPGGLPAMNVSTIHINIDNVTATDGLATVAYTVTNQDEEVIIGIPSATFIAAQLLPQGYTGAGNSSQWQYFTSETCSSASCPGQYIDHKNGHYSYTFSASFNGMNNVTFMNDATQRLVIKLGGDQLADGTQLPITNINTDWQVSGQTPAYTRNLVTIDSCNSCHTDLAFHGSKYNQVETCVTCHNADKVSHSENIFPQMIHAKHLGGFPQSLANCQTCHSENDQLSEQANWNRVPTMETCGSCHTDINFPAGQGHPAQVNNSNCVACHDSDWTMEVHSRDDKDMALAQFAVKIVNASMAVSGTVTVDVSIMNPATGTIYTDSADKLNFVSDLRIYANWGTSFDYATRSARSIKLQELTPVSGANGIYQYQISGLTIPAGSENDKGTLAIQGQICSISGELADCASGSPTIHPIKASHQFFDVASLSDTGRRVVVTNETCATCHADQQLNFHGSRNDLEGQCQLCHNANMQADASNINPSNATADFKQLIHSIHSAKYEGFEDLNYPSSIGNCAQCHTKDSSGVLTVGLPLDSAVQPLALDNGLFTSATAAICSNCHDTSSAKNHMQQQGGMFGVSKDDATAGTESCVTCHGKGDAVDVLKVHPLH